MFTGSPALADELFTTEPPKIPNFSYKDIWHSMHHYFIFLHKSEYIYKFGGGKWNGYDTDVFPWFYMLTD